MRYNDIYTTNSSDLVNSLFNLFVVKKYGEMIYHTEIEKILGFNREVNKYGIYVKKAKDRLIEHSKVLKSIHGIGFIVLKPEQVSGYVYRKYIKRTLNLYNYSTEILDHLNTEDFGATRKQEYDEVKDLNDALKEKTSSIIQTSGYYSRMDYYNSLEGNC